MTPLPKRKLSTRRQGKRRAAITLRTVQKAACSNCKKTIPPHTVCRYCGFYRGRLVNPPRSASHDNKK